MFRGGISPQSQEILCEIVLSRVTMDECKTINITPPTPAVGVNQVEIIRFSHEVDVQGVSQVNVLGSAEISLQYLCSSGENKKLLDTVDYTIAFPLPDNDLIKLAPEPSPSPNLFEVSVHPLRTFLTGQASGQLGCVLEIKGKLLITARACVNVLAIPPSELSELT